MESSPSISSFLPRSSSPPPSLDGRRPTVDGETARYRVLFGRFDSPEAAQAASASLPATMLEEVGTPLLREPTLDGYAPVMSDADPETPAAPRSALLLDAEAVKVGELRVVLSLAEKGPLPSWAAARASPPRAPRPRASSCWGQPLRQVPWASQGAWPGMCSD